MIAALIFYQNKLYRRAKKRLTKPLIASLKTSCRDFLSTSLGKHREETNHHVELR